MNKNELLIEAFQAVFNINENISESTIDQGESVYPLILSTDGLTLQVEFLGMSIWNSEEDEREFNEEKNEYESLELFMISKTLHQLELIKKIKIS
jgi:hypothetical protein